MTVKELKKALLLIPGGVPVCLHVRRADNHDLVWPALCEDVRFCVTERGNYVSISGNEIVEEQDE